MTPEQYQQLNELINELDNKVNSLRTNVHALYIGVAREVGMGACSAPKGGLCVDCWYEAEGQFIMPNLKDRP